MLNDLFSFLTWHFDADVGPQVQHPLVGIQAYSVGLLHVWMDKLWALAFYSDLHMISLFMHHMIVIAQVAAYSDLVEL